MLIRRPDWLRMPLSDSKGRIAVQLLLKVGGEVFFTLLPQLFALLTAASPSPSPGLEEVCGVLEFTSGNIPEGQDCGSPSILCGCKPLQGWDPGSAFFCVRAFIKYVLLHGDILKIHSLTENRI